MIHFEKFAQEGNEFVNELARNLGHEKEKGQVAILMRSVMHVLRESISIPQSFNVIAQLPMFLKAIYVEQWKYHENLARIKTLEEFAQRVEDEQWKFGERDFNWNESTISLVKTVFSTLRKYLQPGQVNDIVAELSAPLKSLFYEKVTM